MVVWVVTSNYFNNMLFGTYSSVLNARKAIENFVLGEDNIVSCIDTEDYGYSLTTKNGEAYWMEIVYDTMDADCD